MVNELPGMVGATLRHPLNETMQLILFLFAWLASLPNVKPHHLVIYFPILEYITYCKLGLFHVKLTLGFFTNNHCIVVCVAL